MLVRLIRLAVLVSIVFPSLPLLFFPSFFSHPSPSAPSFRIHHIFRSSHLPLSSSLNRLQSPIMASNHLVGTADLNLIEAPVTWRAYMICGFASFGG